MECNFTKPVLDEDGCAVDRQSCSNAATYRVEYLADAKLYTKAETMYCCDDHKANAELDTKKNLGSITSLNDTVTCTDVQILSPEETSLSVNLKNMGDSEFLTWMTETTKTAAKASNEFYIGIREMERRWKATGQFNKNLLAIGVTPGAYRMWKMRQLETIQRLELTSGNTTTGVTTCDTTPAKDTKKSDAGKKGGAAKAAKVATKKSGKKPTTNGIKLIKPLPPPTPTTTEDVELDDEAEPNIKLPLGIAKLFAGVNGYLELTTLPQGQVKRITTGFIDYIYDVEIDWNMVREMSLKAAKNKSKKTSLGAITITVTSASEKLIEPEKAARGHKTTNRYTVQVDENGVKYHLWNDGSKVYDAGQDEPIETAPAKKKPVQNQVVIPFTQVGKTQEEIDAHFDAEMEAAHPYFTEREAAV